MDAVSAMSAHERLEGAFALAEEKYGVPRLLTIRGMVGGYGRIRDTVGWVTVVWAGDIWDTVGGIR